MQRKTTELDYTFRNDKHTPPKPPMLSAKNNYTVGVHYTSNSEEINSQGTESHCLSIDYSRIETALEGNAFIG